MGFKKWVVTGAVGVSVFVGGQAVSAHEDTNSIVDYLNYKGEDYSFEARKALAEDRGIVPYKGTAKQNLYLLDLLRNEGVEASSKNINTGTEEDKEHNEHNEQESKQVEGETLTVEATAYTADCSGCSGVTYTGVDLKANPSSKVIAVDPNVIPLGTKVYVEGYGEAVAADIGGAIKGNRIDVFIPNHSDAMDWGRRTVNVTILN